MQKNGLSFQKMLQLGHFQFGFPQSIFGLIFSKCTTTMESQLDVEMFPRRILTTALISIARSLLGSWSRLRSQISQFFQVIVEDEDDEALVWRERGRRTQVGLDRVKESFCLLGAWVVWAFQKISNKKYADRKPNLAERTEL